MGVRLTKPYTDDEELREVAAVLASGFLTQGPKVEEFETQVGAILGCKHAIAVSSATAALHLALLALRIGPGDEVVVADFTYPATGNVVALQGALPVLADITLDHFGLDPASLEEKISPRTRAVIPVHAFGLSAPMDQILQICARYEIPVIEDAACAIGARYHGRPVGTLGTLGCFSFHPRKGITTGEGGMVTTNDDLLAERVRLLRNHGATKAENQMRFLEAGFNFRMSDILAAVGVAQLRKLDMILEARRNIAQGYTIRLGDLDGLRCPLEPHGMLHTYQSYVVLLEEGIDRDAFLFRLRERGVEATIGTYALHCQPFFANAYGYTSGQIPRAWQAYTQSVTLPLYVGMPAADIDQVLDAVYEVMALCR